MTPDDSREAARVARRIAQLEALRAREPDDLVVRFGLAGAYLAVGRFDEAAAEAREALRLKADYSAAFVVLGRALIGAGRIEEARAALSEGIPVADRLGDIMTMKEMRTLLRRLG